MTVLVMDARQPKIIPNRDNPPIDLEVCGHLPLLRYPQPEENKLSGFLTLEGHQIEISDVDLGPDPARPLEIDSSFKNWIPMELVLSDQRNSSLARVDRKFLDFPPPKEIAGRLVLKAGTVTASGSIGRWDFLPSFVNQNPARHPDNFPFESEVIVSIPINKDQAAIRITARDGSVTEKELKPKRGDSANNRSVNLLLSNLCFEDAEHERRPRVEGDFAVFYDLLTSYTGVRRVPRLLGGANQGGGQGTVQGQAHTSPACTGMTANA
jgi:hypothetical protein